VTFVGGDSDQPQAVAADSDGNALLVLSRFAERTTTLLRFNLQGTAVTFSKTLPPVTLPFMRSGSVAMDAAGNGYLTGITTAANYPVKDSLAPCGSVFLSVFDPAGNLIQSTYVEGAPDVNAFIFSALGLGPEFWLNDFKDRDTERNVAFDYCLRSPMRRRVRVPRLPAQGSNATLQPPLRGRIHLQAEFAKGGCSSMQGCECNITPGQRRLPPRGRTWDDFPPRPTWGAPSARRTWT